MRRVRPPFCEEINSAKAGQTVPFFSPRLSLDLPLYTNDAKTGSDHPRPTDFFEGKAGYCCVLRSSRFFMRLRTFSRPDIVSLKLGMEEISRAVRPSTK